MSSATLSGFDLVVNTRRALTRTQFDPNFHCERGVAISLALDTSSDNETAASLDPHAIKPGLREIDWSDLGQGRNGLFAAVCFRSRGLPLLSWVSTPEELNPSRNRLEEFFIGRLLRHLPTSIRRCGYTRG